MSTPERGRIELRDLSLSFLRRGADRLPVLNGVNLSIASGEIVTLIGPNGCGKSSLLRVMAGLLPADSGTVSLGDELITSPDPRIGLVFQEPRLLPWRTVAANVGYPLELAGMPGVERSERVSEALHRVGLVGAEGQLPGQLSGGMRQRAALARALVLAPDVLSSMNRSAPSIRSPAIGSTSSCSSSGAGCVRRSSSSPTASPRRSSSAIG